MVGYHHSVATKQAHFQEMSNVHAQLGSNNYYESVQMRQKAAGKEKKLARPFPSAHFLHHY